MPGLLPYGFGLSPLNSFLGQGFGPMLGNAPFIGMGSNQLSLNGVMPTMVQAQQTAMPTVPILEDVMAQQQMQQAPPMPGGMAVPATSYDELFNRASAITGLPLWFLKGTGAAESDFRMLAPNYAGATGIMQVVPDTFAELQRRYPQHHLTSINDPWSNILAGALYLKEQYDRFGSYELASAAYNAGPGRVAQYKGIPPIKETQRYVPRVMRYRPTEG